MSKSPAVFDIQKLRWMNGEYLKAMDSETFYAAAEPYLKKALTKDFDLHRIAEMVRTRIEVYPDIPEMVAFFEQVPEYDIALFTNKKAKTDAEKSLATLKDLLPRLEASEDFTNDALFEMLKAYTQENGCKVNAVECGRFESQFPVRALHRQEQRRSWISSEKTNPLQESALRLKSWKHEHKRCSVQSHCSRKGRP